MKRTTSKTLKRVGYLAAAGIGVGSAGWAIYGARTWLSFGRTATVLGQPDELLDRFMPTYDVAERHETRVAAPVAITYAAARDMDLHRSRIVRAIFRGRELLMFERGQPRPPQSLLDETLALGWGVLAETPGREIVVGATARPWQGDPEFRALPPEQFASFAEPGYAKIVWTLSAEPLGPASSIFRTETRVLTTDPDSRARFRRYWSIFSPGVLLIRDRGLALVKADAEQRTAASRPLAPRTRP
jgi:hypothetical protein